MRLSIGRKAAYGPEWKGMDNMTAVGGEGSEFAKPPIIDVCV